MVNQYYLSKQAVFLPIREELNHSIISVEEMCCYLPLKQEITLIHHSPVKG
jgi:hypothetical protein